MIKKGQIVRRILHSGTPIGSYIVVTKVLKQGVYGRYLMGEREFFITENKNSLKLLDIVRLQISQEDFNHLHKHNPVTYLHKALKSWINVCNKNVDIAILYDNMGRKLYYINPEFKKICKKHIIARSKRNDKKDIVKLDLFIKMYLNKIWYEM